MDISFWETIGSVIAGAAITLGTTWFLDRLRANREEQAFNRRKKLEAYLEVFEILNDYLAHIEVMKSDVALYQKQLLKINKMNVLTGVFATKRFSRAIKRYSDLMQKGEISPKERERFLNVLRTELKLPLFDEVPLWRRRKVSFRWFLRIVRGKIRENFIISWIRRIKLVH